MNGDHFEDIDATIDVSDGRMRAARNRDASPARGASIDELLDRVLAVDMNNADAEDLLATPGDAGGPLAPPGAGQSGDLR